MFVPEERLIAHDQPGDIRVAPRQIEGGRDLTLVSGFVLVDPDAERNCQPEFCCDLRNTLQTSGRSVGAYRLCQFGNRGEIGADQRL